MWVEGGGAAGAAADGVGAVVEGEAVHFPAEVCLADVEAVADFDVADAAWAAGVDEVVDAVVLGGVGAGGGDDGLRFCGGDVAGGDGEVRGGGGDEGVLIYLAQEVCFVDVEAAAP